MIEELKPYPGYKDSGVPWLGQVPAHWETCRLKSRLVKNDSGIWRDHHDPAGTIILRSTEQTVSGGWKIENPARLHLSHVEREAYLLQVGDLVVTKSSGSPDHIGKTSLVTEDVAALGCAFSNFMQRLRLGENTDPKLVWYYLNSPIGREQLVFQSTTITGLGNLNGKILGNCVIALPPLPEQTAIVRFLDYVDRRIRRYIRAKQKLIKLLQEYKQALIHQAVTGQIDVRTGQPYPAYKPSGVEWLGDVPEHWEVRKLRALFTKAGSGTTPSGEEFYGGDIPWVVTGDLNDSVLSNTTRTVNARALENFSALRLYPKDSLIIAMYGASIGKTAILGIEACTNQACCVLAEPRKGVLVRFIQSAVIFAKGYLVRQGYGGGQPNINSEIVHGFRIPVPPFEEQSAIVEYLDAQTAKIDAAIAAARREIDLLREYRTRLIADVVIGKVDVREVAVRLPEEPREEDSPWTDEEKRAQDETLNGESDHAAIPEEDG